MATQHEQQKYNLNFAQMRSSGFVGNGAHWSETTRQSTAERADNLNIIIISSKTLANLLMSWRGRANSWLLIGWSWTSFPL